MYLNIRSILCAILLASAANLYADIITLRADSWYPYNGTPGPKPGFMIEIAEEVFAAKGHTIDYQVINWARSKHMLTAGKITGVVGMSRHPPNADKWLFPSVEQGMEHTLFYAHPSSNISINGLESLRKLRIGRIIGYEYGEPYDSFIKENSASLNIMSITGNDSIYRLIQMLQRRRIDVFTEDRLVLESSLQQHNIQNNEAIKIVGEVNPPIPVFIVFSKTDPKGHEYAKILSEGTIRLRETGRLKEILTKYGLSDWRQ